MAITAQDRQVVRKFCSTPHVGAVVNIKVRIAIAYLASAVCSFQGLSTLCLPVVRLEVFAIRQRPLLDYALGRIKFLLEDLGLILKCGS